MFEGLDAAHLIGVGLGWLAAAVVGKVTRTRVYYRGNHWL